MVLLHSLSSRACSDSFIQHCLKSTRGIGHITAEHCNRYTVREMHTINSKLFKCNVKNLPDNSQMFV